MAKKERSSHYGVSIIVCTKRHYCMDNLIENFISQRYKHKELIIILNHKELKMKDYIKAAEPYKNIRIYRQPEHVSLGNCLNYGVNMAKYPYIAKFDDDDYYAPDYLKDSMHTLRKTKADIVGKRAHYVYLSSKKLVLYRYRDMAERYVSEVQGATLLFKREVFDAVSFPNRSRGECVKFCSLCRAKGYSIYAGSPYHFAAIRRKGSKDHTWIVSDRRLMKKGDQVPGVNDIKTFVSR
ncbi:glycosyltransferase [Paenibacillus shunpengii]|uniref:Glycosyltransferase n=1 Tax=Paenibacillus shunpengii TaxID=2054424 RepID=A0ABW5SUT6_9BACL|nr:MULTISPECIES: glycosyltransferase [unclassified Paenibacillus]OMC66215.1 glycosyl transferase family 2 [Paenibacillus sp. FSL H7-0326]SDW92033.1 Glycosyl transferase family 2 [Paenibacillus sp. PDC88]